MTYDRRRIWSGRQWKRISTSPCWPASATHARMGCERKCTKDAKGNRSRTIPVSVLRILRLFAARVFFAARMLAGLMQGTTMNDVMQLCDVVRETGHETSLTLLPQAFPDPQTLKSTHSVVRRPTFVRFRELVSGFVFFASFLASLRLCARKILRLGLSTRHQKYGDVQQRCDPVPLPPRLS
jgi:hypothetical protein